MKIKKKKILALIMTFAVMFNINAVSLFAAPGDEAPELFQNWDFSEASWASDWNFSPTAANETPGTLVDGNFQLTSWWAPWPNTVYIEQTVNVTAGETYLLKYSAKANPERPLGLVIDNASTAIPITLTENFEEYTREVVARTNQLTIRFQLGAAWVNNASVQYDDGTLRLGYGPTITFESISLKQVSSDPSDPEEPENPEPEQGTLETPSVADARLDGAISGKDIVLTFDSSEVTYRDAITGIYINQEEVPASLYTIGDGTITLDKSLFPVASGDQNFRILITAQDYRHQILYQNVSAEGKWTSTFEDNFDGDTLDGSKWDYQNGMGRAADGSGNAGWGNNEQQYYTDDNVSVSNGQLVITATKNSRRTQGYSTSYDSGKIRTKITLPDGKEGDPLFSQKYGRFEAKIKMPANKSADDNRYQGFWPAFWMMPTNNEYGGWANSGEIDIMEAKGRFPNNVGGAIHYGGNWPNNIYQSGDSESIYEMDINDYHVYAIEWEEQTMRWYVDGVLYFTANRWYNNNDTSTFPAPFDKEFSLILNLAVGGTFDNGRVPDDSILPAEMKVDYVRVYQFGYEEQGEEGWVAEGAKWKYQLTDGTFAVDWKEINGQWYYFNEESEMVTGWLQYGGSWYYLTASGAMATGWNFINGQWFYMTNTGRMATGWLNDGIAWYYLTNSGAMATGWNFINGQWFYMTNTGNMLANQWVGDYYLTESGAMATNAWIGDVYVGPDGKKTAGPAA